MAISATYLQLQQQIAMELGDKTQLLPSATGIWSPIKNSIQTAIAKWEREPFYFNQVYDDNFFATVIAQQFYTAVDDATIATTVEIERLSVRIGSNWHSLTQRRWNYLADIAAASAVGDPTDFAYFAQQIRLYPIPDAIRVIALVGTKRLAALAADADTNVWTQDGFDLIKAEAKLILASEYLHDAALAAATMAAIHGVPASPERNEREGILTMLRKETLLRTRPELARATRR